MARQNAGREAKETRTSLKPGPLVNLPVKLRTEIEQWAARQPNRPSLSEAVTRLVEKALEIERKLDEQNAHAEIVHLLLRMRDHIPNDDVEFLERRAAGYGLRTMFRS